MTHVGTTETDLSHGDNRTQLAHELRRGAPLAEKWRDALIHFLNDVADGGVDAIDEAEEEIKRLEGELVTAQSEITNLTASARAVIKAVSDLEDLL